MDLIYLADFSYYSKLRLPNIFVFFSYIFWIKSTRMEELLLPEPFNSEFKASLTRLGVTKMCLRRAPKRPTKMRVFRYAY